MTWVGGGARRGRKREHRGGLMAKGRGQGCAGGGGREGGVRGRWDAVGGGEWCPGEGEGAGAELGRVRRSAAAH